MKWSMLLVLLALGGCGLSPAEAWGVGQGGQLLFSLAASAVEDLAGPDGAPPAAAGGPFVTESDISAVTPTEGYNPLDPRPEQHDQRAPPSL
jgi:hypothetical protein